MKRIKAWFKFNWKNYRIQLLGSSLLIPAFVFALLAVYVSGVYSIVALWEVENKALLFFCYGAWVLYIIIGLLDWYIIRRAKAAGVDNVTITKWYRALLPKKVDNIYMISFIGLMWVLVGPLLALYYLKGFLNNHLNEDRSSQLTKHSSDCYIFSVSKESPLHGICTCGYGMSKLRKGDSSEMYSVERLAEFSSLSDTL